MNESQGPRPGIVVRVARAAGRLLGRLVADRQPDRRPPLANYIPDSDGSGGRVISSGHPGGGH